MISRCAHINEKTLEEQSVELHLGNVSLMAGDFGAKVSLANTGKLIGMLHDMGKGTNRFDSYIRYCLKHPKDKSLKGSVDHSTAGAKYIHDNFYMDADSYRQFTAQIISLIICSHHGGLIDCLDLCGIDKFTNRMNSEKDIFYYEALNYFKTECMGVEKVKDLFDKACEEIKEIINKILKMENSSKTKAFGIGMLTKFLFSCVIDADRYDTYLFSQNLKPCEDIDRKALWKELSEVLEAKLETFPRFSKIDLLRAEVSITCRNFGQNSVGVYQLPVPTGGGKTLSSLRYALNHAKKFNKDRIFYIIPFTTIIDQTAKELKAILGREDVILEHHSNLVIDQSNDEHKDDDNNVSADENYRLLTERWDSPIILTTMVQFLNTLFSGGTQGIRRMHNLSNSVIIFDEIQAIPIKCVNMFNSAINFLSGVCNATIVLCTATQPLLSDTEVPLRLSENANMISNMNEELYEFKRVNLENRTIAGGYTKDLLNDFVLGIMTRVDSLLIIVNTKNTARDIFHELKKSNETLPEKEKCLIFHLSTNMCPSNRLNILKEIKSKLGTARVVCVSTQLIEAGVNISFECVVRSLAGLDSIAQAAGRCNRHGEKTSGYGDVYIVNIEGENISKLVDISKGQECTKRVLDEYNSNPALFDNDLLSKKAMDMYYKYYFNDRKIYMNYTLSKPHSDKVMYDILSLNDDGTEAFKSRNASKPKLMLKHAFKTAGTIFEPIDQNTTGIIVPYKEGKELITLINGDCSLGELKQNLKKAQMYSVNLFENDFRKLESLEAIVPLKDGVILGLREEFYNEEVGVVFEKAMMDFLIIEKR